MSFKETFTPKFINMEGIDIVEYVKKYYADVARAYEEGRFTRMNHALAATIERYTGKKVDFTFQVINKQAKKDASKKKGSNRGRKKKGTA
jgi:hypothetical protein